MFTIDIIIGILKRCVGFLWEYKYTILISMIITALYIRGNNYKQDYQEETIAHYNTVLQYSKQLSDIRLANEQALRIALEESTANYKALVEKTSKIQKEYIQREEDINTNIDKLSASNDSLFKQIKSYTSNINSSGGTVSDSSTTKRLQITGELLSECVGRKQYYAYEADRLNNSVKTLQEWGNMVIEENKGEKDE